MIKCDREEKGGGFQVVCKYVVIVQQVRMQESNSVRTKTRAETGNHSPCFGKSPLLLQSVEFKRSQALPIYIPPSKRRGLAPFAVR